MTFLEWTFLLWMAAVIGPVAAHLLSKPRFRRVPFTMLRFLRSGQRESHARRRLRDLLILLLRCALIVLIAMLFAQPVLKVATKPKPHKSIHYLCVDDSMSMAYRDGDATLLAKAIEAAVQYVTGLSDESICHIYAMASRRSFENLGKAQAMAALRQLAPAPRNADIAEFLSIVRQARRAASTGDAIRAAVFSDFAPDVLAQLDRVGEPAIVDDIRYEQVLPDKPIDDAAITHARLADGAAGLLSLDVTLANGSPVRQVRTLTARGPDLSPVSLQARLAPRQRQVCRLPLSLGAAGSRRACIPIELSLSGQDGLAANDTYRLAAYVPPTTVTHVLLAGDNEETFLFEAALQALSKQGPSDAGGGSGPALQLREVTEDQLAAAHFGWADVVVLASPPQNPACRPVYVESLLKKGGRLICFATHADNLDTSRLLMDQGYLAALPEKWVQAMSYPEPAPFAPPASLFDEQAGRSLINYRLDRIALKGYWLCRPAPQSQCLWRLTDGTGFIYGKSVDRGLSILVNTSIDGSLGLLAKSPAWVAFCQYLLGRTEQVRQYSISTVEPLTLYLPQIRPAVAVTVENCDGSKVSVRPQGTALRLPVPTGLGWMRTLDPPLSFGVNLPDCEMEIAVSPTETVANAVKRAFQIDDHREPDVARAELQLDRKPIWRAFAWAAIAMVLLESAVANRLRR